jgi:hypothetical protein
MSSDKMSTSGVDATVGFSPRVILQMKINLTVDHPFVTFLASSFDAEARRVVIPKCCMIALCTVLRAPDNALDFLCYRRNQTTVPPNLFTSHLQSYLLRRASRHVLSS